jgi:tRNA-dihydrouridine synthase B
MKISIGNIEIPTPVFLAPMSGVSDWPFRHTVKKFGASMVFSEMIASRESLSQKHKSLRHADNYNEEYPIAVQLAGCDPEIMADAAKLNVDRGADIIDINFGCPVKKVVKKLAGSALMREPELATEIMAATVKAVNVPVTMKMRLGWDHDNLNAPDFAKRAEDVGIQMLTVHGRTRDQMYTGTADWQAIKATTEATSLPVTVNGDVNSPENAKKAMDISGAQGVMIGRHSQGRPWLLKQTMDYLSKGHYESSPSTDIILKTIIDHYDMILDYYGQPKGIGIARKHINWYCADMPKSKEFMQDIFKQTEPSIVKDLIRHFFEQQI